MIPILSHLTGKQKLLAIYLLLIAIVCFRILVHPTGYTTPDSIAYLDQSELIKHIWEKAMSPLDYLEVKQGFLFWPIGYPLSIALISKSIGTSALWSSKILNFLFLGMTFFLFWVWFGEKAWVLALSFLSYGALEVISETWSETPFLFFVFFLAFIISKEDNLKGYVLFLLTVFTLMALFLYRYVGLIYFFLIATIMVQHLLKRRKRLVINYFMSLLAASVFVLVYFKQNMVSAGSATGTGRFDPNIHEIGMISISFIKAFVNEFLIARNFSHDPLFYLLSASQVLLIAYLIKNKSLIKSKEWDFDSARLLWFSLFYLVSIFILQNLTHVDAFDFRILFPFSIPFFVGLGVFYINNSQNQFYQRTIRYIVFFMLLSLIVNLPKLYIMEQFNSIFIGK